MFTHIQTTQSSVEQKGAAASLASRGPGGVVLLRCLCYFSASAFVRSVLGVPVCVVRACGCIWGEGEGGPGLIMHMSDSSCACKGSGDCVCRHGAFFFLRVDDPRCVRLPAEKKHPCALQSDYYDCQGRPGSGMFPPRPP